MQSHDAVGVGHISDVPPRCILRVQSSVLRLLPLFLVAQSLGKASLSDHGYSGLMLGWTTLGACAIELMRIKAPQLE